MKIMNAKNAIKAFTLSTLIMIGTNAYADQIMCKNYSNSLVQELSIQSLSVGERDHLGASLKFTLKDHDGAKTSGVVVELSSANASVRTFALFLGAPFVKNPAKAAGILTLVKDSSRPAFSWKGINTELDVCSVE